MEESKARTVAAQLRKPEGEDGIRTGRMMNEGNAQMNRDAITMLNPSPNDRILEVGMGNGFFVQEIVSRHPSIKYTGIDYSETMVEEAKKLNQSWAENGQVKFIQGSVDRLPFTDQSFTKILSVNTIYFWEQPAVVLNELYRVLATGGNLVIAIRPKHQMINYPFTKFGFTLYAKEDIITILQAAGFINIRSAEHTEPEFELRGERFTMENLVVSGSK
jgi:ubiquinone/menaquinone biosynthesis C-methylase UbiE